MLIRASLFSLLLCLPVLPSARAQESDEVTALRATVQFFRDSVVKGPIVIDPELSQRAPGVTPEVADQVAAGVGARRARVGETLQCASAAAGVRPKCTMRDGATVVSFGRPDIRDTAATVVVTRRYLSAAGHLEYEELGFRLARTGGGAREVRSARALGAG